MGVLLLIGLFVLSWLTQRPCGGLERPVRLVAQVSGSGRLRAGAASQPLSLDYPVVRAGYAPPRTDATEARMIPRARAVVLEVGPARIGWVSLELMLVSGELSEAIRARAEGLRLGMVFITATHAHTSAGGYERSTLLQVAGTGRYRADVREAIVSASIAALAEAAERLQPSVALQGSLSLPGQVGARSGGTVDDRLSRLELRADPSGAPIAELLLFSAHPTLAPHPDAVLDPDYPARLSAQRERGWGAVSLFLPASIGNGSAHLTHPVQPGTLAVDLFARALAQEVGRIPMAPIVDRGAQQVSLTASRVAFDRPSPDLQRLLPSWVEPIGEALLCQVAPEESEVATLSLGRLRWVAVPGEPSGEAARRIEASTGAGRTVAVTGDYLSYVETPEHVKENRGEARNQYFDASLLERMEEAAKLGFRTRRGP